MRKEIWEGRTEGKELRQGVWDVTLGGDKSYGVLVQSSSTETAEEMGLE